MSAHRSNRGHAVVIGGSMNGMAVGTLLSQHFDRVTLLDRDTLTEEPTPRRRAPQGHHPNLLQMVGRRELDQLFPGVIAAMKQQGAYEFEMGSEVARFSRFGWTPNAPVHRTSLACTRPTVEAEVRRKFRAQCPDVRLIDRIGVTGYRFEGEGDGLRVVGVTTDSSDPALASLDADLVVDCGGRGSKAFRWLGEVGVPEPDEWRVDARCNYATRYFRPPPEAKDWWWRAMAVEAVPPDFPRGGVLLPTEDGRWLVTAIGINGDYAPTGAEDWMQWVRDLRAPALGQVLDMAEPVTDVVQSRSMVNYWKQMHRYPHLPHGLLLFGDVMAAFNPSYGQGITAGVLSARLLQKQLEAHTGAVDKSFVQRFYKRQAKLLHEGWRYSTSLDFRWPQTTGPRSWMLELDRIGADLLEDASAHDPEIMRRVLPLLDFGANYWTLAHPVMLARVSLHLLKRLVARPRLPAAAEFDPCSLEAPLALPA